MDNFSWHICDTKGRLLFGMKKDVDQLIFARYADMTEEELDTSICVYAFSLGIPDDADILADKRVKKMLNYLTFKEENDGDDDFCG